MNGSPRQDSIRTWIKHNVRNSCNGMRLLAHDHVNVGVIKLITNRMHRIERHIQWEVVANLAPINTRDYWEVMVNITDSEIYD